MIPANVKASDYRFCFLSEFLQIQTEELGPGSRAAACYDRNRMIMTQTEEDNVYQHDIDSMTFQPFFSSWKTCPLDRQPSLEIAHLRC
jgi:hypothetical protein